MDHCPPGLLFQLTFETFHIIVCLTTLCSQWLRLTEWQSFKECSFFLVEEGRGNYYQFCKGLSGLELVKKSIFCDGKFDCSDRKVKTNANACVY